jgi:putative redox protein
LSTTIDLSFNGGYKVTAAIGPHEIPVDLPSDEGGEDTGPTPSDLFLASLATCSAIYFRELCRARNIPTEGMAFRSTAHYDEKEKRYTRIVSDLTLPPGFPEKYRPVVLRMIDSCFVKNQIDHPPELETNLIPS